MAKIEESDPNQKVLWVKAADGQVETIMDVQAHDGTSYFSIAADGTVSIAGLGDVSGPAGATDNAITRFNGVTGKSVQDSVVTIADTTGTLSINGHQALSDPTATPTGKYLRDDGTWQTVSSGAGDVVGPSGATDNAFARYDTATGKLIQDSLVTSDDSGSVNIPSGQHYKINNVNLSASDVGAATSSHNHDSDYISVVSTPTTGNFPQLTAGGELVNSTYDETSFATSGHNHDTAYISVVATPTAGNFPVLTSGGELNNSTYNNTTFALAANGVTNGDSHDHSGGDGAQIAHTALSSIGTNTHAQIDTHISAASPHTSHAIGIASTTDNRVVRFDSTGGKQLQDSLMTIDDSGSPNIPSGQTYKINGSAHTHTASDIGLGNVTNNAQIKDPGSSVDNQVLRWDGVAGDTVQACLLTVDDTGTTNIPSGQTYNINGSAHTHATANHALTNAVHAETGLTSGHFLKATGTTTFAFGAHGLTYTDVGAAASSHNHAGSDINSGTIDGDRLPAMSTTKKGGVPATGTPAGLFLKDDGTWSAPSGSGDVVGPSSATDLALARFDLTSGKLIQNSVITVADTTGALSINGHQALTDPTASPSNKFLRDDGTWQTPGGSGDVTGPPSSTDNAIARFDGIGGKTLQNSLITIDDTGTINIPSGQTYNINGSAHTHTGLVTNGDSHDHSGGDGAQIAHTALSSIGTNTHAQIDTHLASTSNPHSTTASQVGAIADPGSSVDEQVLRWNGITGDTVQACLLTVSDTGTCNIPTGQTYNINGSAHSHSHTTLSDIGTNAHSTIDTHLSSTSNPHSTTAAQVGAIADPGSSVDEQVLRWNGITGDTVQACLLTVSDTGTCNIPSGQTYNINGSAHSHSHTALSDIGTNAHSTIDTHLAAASPHTSHAIGIASTTDNRVVRFDSTGGKQLQDSLMTIDDTGTVNIPSGQTYNINGTAHTHTGLVTNGDSHDHSGGDGAQIAHTSLSSIGTNTHAQIDTHLGSTSNPHSTTAAQVGAIADPGSSVDEQVLRWNGTTGDTVQACLLTVSDTGTCNIPTGQTYNINGSAHTHTGFINDPGSSVDEQLLRWNGTTGDTVQACLLTVDDSGSANIPTGQTYKINGTAHGHSATYGLNFIIDGGGSTITTGVKGYVEFPFAATLTGWTALADQSGSIVVDVWKDTYANFPPLVADTMIATGTKPTISSATKGQDLTIDWATTSISAGDILAFNVDSITTCQRVTISLYYTRSV